MDIKAVNLNSFYNGKSAGGYLNAGDQSIQMPESDKPERDEFSERLAKGKRKDKIELIHSLSSQPDEDDVQIAMKSYFQMQGMINNAIKNENAGRNEFTALMDEKAYYSSLADEASNSGKAALDGGRYAFSGAAAGSTVTEQEALNALGDVQKRIDSFLDPYDAKSDVGAAASDLLKRYSENAKTFAEITGSEGDALTADTCLLTRKNDRTEANYLTKSDEALKSLSRRSSDLSDMMKSYMGENGDEDGMYGITEEQRVKLEVAKYLADVSLRNGDPTAQGVLAFFDDKA